MIEIQQLLEQHAYMWSRQGPIAMSGDVIGHSKIRGRKNPNVKIWVQNFGTTQRPDWRYIIYLHDQRMCINWHFASAEAALLHAWEWSESADQPPKLRRFEWYKGHFAYAVDGYDGVKAVVVEFTTGQFQLRITEKDGRTNHYHDPAWKTPMEALTV